MTNTRITLIWVAFWTTCYASLAFLTNLEPDFTIAAITAALTLFAVVCLDWAEWKRRNARLR